MSKNHSSSSISSGSNSLADSVRRALKPHWASLNPPRNRILKSRLYERSRSTPPWDCGTPHVRPGSQPTPDRHVAVPREKWCHQWEEAIEIGREIHVHIGDDFCAVLADHGVPPGKPKPRPLRGRWRAVTPGMSLGKPSRYVPRAVGAGIVHDAADGGLEGKRGIEKTTELVDTGLENTLLVVDRNGQFDDGCRIISPVSIERAGVPES